MTALVSKASKKPSIGLTPLIDVVFILLIFFMLVMQFQSFQQNDIKLSSTRSTGVKKDGVAKVVVESSVQCKYQNVVQPCDELFSQLGKSSVSRIVLGYSDDVALQHVMSRYDQLSEHFTDVSLAIEVPLPEGNAK